MAWMTTADIKSYLGITDATYDTQIDKYNPVAQSRVEQYIGRYEECEYFLPLGFEPDYSRLVWLMINEASIDIKGGNVKSWAFDGESVSYGDATSKDVAKTSNEQLLKFNPLVKRYV